MYSHRWECAIAFYGRVKRYLVRLNELKYGQRSKGFAQRRNPELRSLGDGLAVMRMAKSAHMNNLIAPRDRHSNSRKVMTCHLRSDEPIHCDWIERRNG